jgi:predicted ABC-type ATPase
MDPCSGGIPINEQKKRHQRYIDELQKALTTCKNEMFTGWDDNFDNYEYLFAKGSYSTTKRSSYQHSKNCIASIYRYGVE